LMPEDTNRDSLISSVGCFLAYLFTAHNFTRIRFLWAFPPWDPLS